jgi:Rieske 2Fe-2S family protein
MEALTDGAETMTVFERFKMQDMRIGARIVYEVAANWKIVVENYNECLHCPQIHPELVQVVPLFRFGEVWDEETHDDGNWMVDGATSFTKTGESSLPKFPGLNEEDYKMYYGSYEFPNLMLNLHPDAVMYYVGYPKGPNHTTVVSEFLFRPETIASPHFDPSSVVQFWDLISTQDWGVCERAQTGVSSRAFTRGVYPRQDRFLYWFNEEWRVKMGRAPLG